MERDGLIRRKSASVLGDGNSYTLALADGRQVGLNGMAWQIWERLEYPVRQEIICRELGAAYDVDPEVCRSEVQRFLQELDRFGLLQTQIDPSAVEPCRDRYLKLLKRALTNLIYPEDLLRVEFLVKRPLPQSVDMRVFLRDIRYTLPEAYAELLYARRLGLPRATGYSFTMVGLPRLDNIERCAETIFAEDIPGDFLEAGVCRGGCTIFMRGLQKSFDQSHRSVWLADSFDGVPPPSSERDIQSGLDLSKDCIPQLVASLSSVLDNFRTFDLLDHKVRILPGLFQDTLPTAPIDRLALLRLDGDLYSSTMDTLDALYDKVSPGGFIIVDDYGALAACRDAVTEFRTRRNIRDTIEIIDYTGIFWRKSA